MDDALFHRKPLAEQLAKRIMLKAIGSAAPSGIFLAASYGTGKSTFIAEDLLPQLHALGALVVHADLQGDAGDVGLAISNSIGSALQHQYSRDPSAQGPKGGEWVNSFCSKIGLGKEITYTTALVALSAKSRKMIVLLIDEAQLIIQAADRMAIMAGLKAARDELNSSKHCGLRIVFVGASRADLAELCTTRHEPFFATPLVDLPLLGHEFIQWLCNRPSAPGDLQPDEVFDLFRLIGHRPGLLRRAMEALHEERLPHSEQLIHRLADLLAAQADITNSDSGG
ncbi:ATP-binding protein [Pseudomonas sp. NPDC089547]|uniref:ATP-binding protein n=1 Tax=Pseudomonas sp. NPDC089547 TaxID=3390652 RepID=UPI003D006042